MGEKATEQDVKECDINARNDKGNGRENFVI